MPMKVKEYAAKLGATGKCDVAQLFKLTTLVKEDGEALMPSDAPAPEAAETTGSGGMDAAFLAECTKEVQDCMNAKGDPAKLKACLGKLKKLLMMHGDLNDEAVKDDKPADAGEDAKKKAEEAAKAKPTGPTESELVQECFAEGLAVTPNQFAALKGMSDKTARTSFIREQKGLMKATDPKAASREQLGGTSGTVKEDGTGGTQKSGVEQARERARKHAAENQGVKDAK
jgi:hypothetical protein